MARPAGLILAPCAGPGDAAVASDISPLSGDPGLWGFCEAKGKRAASLAAPHGHALGHGPDVVLTCANTCFAFWRASWCVACRGGDLSDSAVARGVRGSAHAFECELDTRILDCRT
eukprot:1186530-Prymnesium_polylepis.2